jgi:glycosyltransferase involved in cell wall biosynthesis
MCCACGFLQLGRTGSGLGQTRVDDPEYKGVIVEKGHNRMDVNSSPNASSSRPLRIAFCLPELKPLHQLMGGELTNASYIQQGYIAAGLHAHGHSMTFVPTRGIGQIVCASDLQRPKLAPQTWSASRWFNIASRGIWCVQRWLGVPYLNMFSNYHLFDVCLQCLPGHDLVHERNGLYRVGVAMACQRLRLPYVLFFDADEILEHDFMGEPITGILRWRARGMVRYNLRAADCVICVSEPAKAHLVTTWNVPADKIAVFPNGVDVQRFRPYPEARSEVRRSLGADTNPLIVFVGNFYRWHDVTTLLDAFGQVLATYPGARLVLVGDGSQRQAMTQHTIDVGIGHAVQFTGFMAHSEVPRLLAAADVAVAPYPTMKQDLWLSPMKLFEYMASGTAVVASAVGQVAKVVKDGGNGLLVPPGDASAMAAALKKLIDDAALRSRLGQQAREDAVRKHSWEHYVSRLERVYAAVVAGQPFNLI